MGAVLEGISHGIPGIAISLEADPKMIFSGSYGTLNWAIAKKTLRTLVEGVLTEGLATGAHFLNVNVPGNATWETPMKITRLGRGNYFSFVKPEKRGMDSPYRLASKKDPLDPDLKKDTDIYSFLKDQVITLTPLTWDMTAHEALK